MSRTAQSTERKKVTFVDNDVNKETLSAPISSEMLLEQAILQSATPLSVLSNNSEGNGYSNKNKIGSLQPRRNSLQPIKNMNAIASHCVNFDQFLSSIKESNGQTYLSNNCNSTTNGECDANGERVLNVNNSSDNTSNHNLQNRVNANIDKRLENKERSNNSKKQLHQEKINALEDPYAPEHQGSVYSTIPELTISSQNEQSRRSVNSINSNNTVNSNYSISKKNTRNYTQGPMHWDEYNSNYDNNYNGNDDNSNSNSLGNILYSQQPMRGKRLRSENIYHSECEEEQLLHLSPIPSFTRKRHRLQPSCSLENTNNEESQERMHSIRQSRQSLSQYDQRLLDKYQSNIEKMNTRLHKMEKQLAEHLLPISQEIAESKVKYDELCGKLGTIEQLLSQELKSTSTTSSVKSSQLTEESNSTKSALEEVKTEISKLCQVFTSMEQKVNALSSTSNVHSLGSNNTAVAKETPSTLEKPQIPSPVLTLQPTQPREVQVVGEMISEHNSTNPFSFVKEDNEQKVNTTGNESGVVGDMNDFSSHDTTNKPTNFFTFGASTKNDSNTKNDRSNNESVGAADSATNTTLAFQQTTNPLPTKDNVNDVQDNKNNSTSTIFAPITAEATQSFTSNDNNNDNMTTSTTSVNNSAANPFATCLSKANTTSSPFSFANATSNAATVANNSNDDTATTNTATSISDTSTNADANIGSTSNDTNNKDDHNRSNAKPANPFTFASSTNNFNFGSSTAANSINAQDSNNVTSPFSATSSFAKISNPSPISANPFAFSSTSRNPLSASTTVKDSEATNTLSNDATTMKASADDKNNSITNSADSANKTNPPTFGFGFNFGQVTNTKTERADTSNTPFAATNTYASAFGSKLADSTINSNTTSTAAFPFTTPSTAPSLTSTSLPANNTANNSATMTNPFSFNSTSVASSIANSNNNLNGLPTESSTPAFANTTIDNSNNTNLFSGFGTQPVTTSSSSSTPFSSVAPANANTNNIFGNAALPSTGVNSFGAVNNSLGNVSNPFAAFGGGSNNNNISGGNVGSSVVDTHILGTATRKKTTRRY